MIVKGWNSPNFYFNPVHLSLFLCPLTEFIIICLFLFAGWEDRFIGGETGKTYTFFNLNWKSYLHTIHPCAASTSRTYWCLLNICPMNSLQCSIWFIYPFLWVAGKWIYSRYIIHWYRVLCQRSLNEFLVMLRFSCHKHRTLFCDILPVYSRNWRVVQRPYFEHLGSLTEIM